MKTFLTVFFLLVVCRLSESRATCFSHEPIRPLIDAPRVPGFIGEIHQRGLDYFKEVGMAILEQV